MLSLEIIGYLSIFLMGLTLGLIGAGGSILTVPILVYLFALSPTLATAYSLALVGATALAGGLKHLMHGNFDREAFLVFGLPSILSVYLSRRFLLPAIPPDLGSIAGLEVTRDGLIMLVFSFLMLAAASLMIRGRRSGSKNETKENLNDSARPRHLIAALEGSIVGAVTGLVGAGGGFLIVPVMIWLLKLPIRIAVATSLLVIAAKSLIGFAGDLQIGQPIDWTFLLQLFALSLLGILTGSRYSQKIPTAHLQKGFGYFILIAGILILGKEFSA